MREREREKTRALKSLSTDETILFYITCMRTKSGNDTGVQRELFLFWCKMFADNLIVINEYFEILCALKRNKNHRLYSTSVSSCDISISTFILSESSVRCVRFFVFRIHNDQVQPNITHIEGKRANIPSESSASKVGIYSL
jgi:hypothetical protein